MKAPVRLVSSFLLSLVIAVTSVGFASARGQSYDATGTVILCTAQGIVSVTLDGEGNPVGPQHICPDCVISTMAFADAPAIAPIVEFTAESLGRDFRATSLCPATGPELSRVRGPPSA